MAAMESASMSRVWSADHVRTTWEESWEGVMVTALPTTRASGTGGAEGAEAAGFRARVVELALGWASSVGGASVGRLESAGSGSAFTTSLGFASSTVIASASAFATLASASTLGFASLAPASPASTSASGFAPPMLASPASAFARSSTSNSSFSAVAGSSSSFIAPSASTFGAGSASPFGTASASSFIAASSAFAAAAAASSAETPAHAPTRFTDPNTSRSSFSTASMLFSVGTTRRCPTFAILMLEYLWRFAGCTRMWLKSCRTMTPETGAPSSGLRLGRTPMALPTAAPRNSRRTVWQFFGVKISMGVWPEGSGCAWASLLYFLSSSMRRRPISLASPWTRTILEGLAASMNSLVWRKSECAEKVM
mmetsp:Transcript_28577/g.71732  ORF Transcript_28577/g.71732 Transcript_28577/m.71732 type:complete len:368 (-) Transcript_28577:493-1596(-)